MTPNKGPRSGGTQLTIKGSHLNIGSSVRVLLKDYPCHVNTSHSSSTRITCTTSEAASNETVDRIQVNIDDAVRVLGSSLPVKMKQSKHNHRKGLHRGDEDDEDDSDDADNQMDDEMEPLFHYLNDPTIVELKPLKSFVSGGRMITVHGTNLDSIQSPEMVVYADQPGDVIINRTVSQGGSIDYQCCLA